MDSSACVRSQLLDSIVIMIENDFPANWEDLGSETMRHLKSSDPAEVQGALFVLYHIASKYEYDHSLSSFLI